MTVTVDIGDLDATRQISGIVESKLAAAAMLIEPAQRAHATASVVVRESFVPVDGLRMYEAVCDASIYGRDVHAAASAPGVFSAIRQMKQRLAWQILAMDGSDTAR